MSSRPTSSDTCAGRKQLTHIMGQFEEIVLSLLLLTLIILSCSRILLRLFNYGGMLWVDPLLRNLVLWSGLLGAAMATSHGKHISLDLVSYLIPPRWQPWMTLLNSTFSTLTAGILTWASVLFLLSEREYGITGLFGIPSYQWNLVFPLTFGLITLRYAWKAIQSLTWIATNTLPFRSTDP